jgi:hypothetical protein
MATREAGLLEVFKAIKVKWDASDLATLVRGGIQAFDRAERSDRPYAIVDSIGETPTTFTNKGKYSDVAFQIELIGTTLEDVGSLIGRILFVMGETLTIETVNGSRCLRLMPGRVTYITESNYMRAICEWTARIAQDRRS